MVTNIDLDHKPQVAFPAVSICNLNRIHCINLMTEYQNVLEKLKSLDSKPDKKEIKKWTDTKMNMTKIFFTTGCNEQVTHKTCHPGLGATRLWVMECNKGISSL